MQTDAVIPTATHACSHTQSHTRTCPHRYTLTHSHTHTEDRPGEELEDTGTEPLARRALHTQPEPQ